MFSATVRKIFGALAFKVALAFFGVLFAFVLGPGLLSIDVSRAMDDDDDNDDNDFKGPKFCSQTAQAAFRACRNEVRDDFWIAIGNCINVSDGDARRECKDEAQVEKRDGLELCKEQYDARLEVCELVGETRYDPDFDPDNFLPGPVGNRYFPLGVGNQWVYEGTFEDEDGEEITETITVKVLRATKLIEGVTCIVVNDVVEADGELIEDTDDWYAQHKKTNDIWYCGEIARNFETFEGDKPALPELVDIDGSWKAGRDGAKPGILVKAKPKPGDAYRQEQALGEAEDVAQVLSNDYVFGGDTEDPDSLDYRVPGDLAIKLCGESKESKESKPCVVTRDLTALEPGVEERKYYAPGIGVFLEVNRETGETVELVSCNFEPCKSILP